MFWFFFQGEKEKNIVDVHNFNLTLPTLEYHNRTWTWHDLLIAMKKDCVNVLVSQVNYPNTVQSLIIDRKLLLYSLFVEDYPSENKPTYNDNNVF